MKLDLSKEKIEWIAFGVMAFIVILVVGIVFFVRPALTQKKVLFEKYLVQNEEVNSQERMSSRKHKLEDSVAKFKDKKEELSLAAPRSSGSFSILSILNQEALECGLVFSRIEPKDVSNQKLKKISGYTQKDFLLNFSAGFHQLGHFVNRLENISPFIQIRDINITDVPQMNEVHQIRLVIRCLVVTS